MYVSGFEYGVKLIIMLDMFTLIVWKWSAWDSNTGLLDYKSDMLTNRPHYLKIILVLTG